MDLQGYSTILRIGILTGQTILRVESIGSVTHLDQEFILPVSERILDHLINLGWCIQ